MGNDELPVLRQGHVVAPVLAVLLAILVPVIGTDLHHASVDCVTVISNAPSVKGWPTLAAGSSTPEDPQADTPSTKQALNLAALERDQTHAVIRSRSSAQIGRPIG